MGKFEAPNQQALRQIMRRERSLPRVVSPKANPTHNLGVQLSEQVRSEIDEILKNAANKDPWRTAEQTGQMGWFKEKEENKNG